MDVIFTECTGGSKESKTWIFSNRVYIDMDPFCTQRLKLSKILTILKLCSNFVILHRVIGLSNVGYTRTQQLRGTIRHELNKGKMNLLGEFFQPLLPFFQSLYATTNVYHYSPLLFLSKLVIFPLDLIWD